MCLGLSLFYIKESPYVLFKLKNIKKLYQVLFFIAKENRKNIDEVKKQLNDKFKLQYLDIQSFDNIKSLRLVKKDEKQLNKTNVIKRYAKHIFKILTDKSITYKMIGVILITTNIYIGYSLSILIPQRLGLSNIYINGVFLGVSEIIGNFLIIPFGNTVPRRYLNFFCSLSITFLALILILFEFQNINFNESFVHWMQTLISSLIKLIYCMNFALIFNYAAELFPTKVRGMTLGIVILFGRFSTVFSITLGSFTDSLGIHPMIGVIFGSVLSLPVSLLLPETLGKGVLNQFVNIIMININQILFLK